MVDSQLAEPPGGAAVPTPLRAWRERALLTQEQLAERTGLGVRTIRRMEASDLHRPQSGSVRLLADVLGLTDDEREQLIAAARGVPAKPAHSQPATTSDASTRVPRQLPPEAAGFAGRARHLDELNGLLEGDRQAATVVISTIAGTAGIGKTALALHWAHRVAAQFPDGQLYANLRGFDPTGSPMTPGEAIRSFLDAFSVTPDQIPTSVDAQAALYRSLLVDRRVLVVLDNACDTDQVRPLLPGSPGCVVVVTSRNQLSSLVAAQGAHALTVDLLTPAEAHDLLVNRLGADRVRSEPDALDMIINRCARLPLALAVTAARAAMNPSFSLDVLANELAEARHDLDALADGEPATDVRAVFSWSYRRLTDDAARLFRLLGAHPGPDITTPAMASLAGVPVKQIRPALAELTRANLLTEHKPGRFTSHDLLRTYAAELVRSVETDANRLSAIRRGLDHYLHTAHAAESLLDPQRTPITMDPPSGVTPEAFADHRQAIGWLTAEHTVLMATVRLAVDAGLDAHAWRLAWALTTFLDRQGHWHDQVAVQRIALDAAGRQADPTGLAHTHRNLALGLARLRRDGDAQTHCQHALELFTQLGDHPGQATTLCNLAWISEQQGRLTEALSHAQHALDVYRAIGDRAGQARALNATGWLHTLLGNHQQALVNCHQALALYQEIGSLRGEGATWDSLGYAHYHLGDHRRANICYQKSIALYREIRDRHNEADVLDHLGDNHRAVGDHDAAETAWQRALTILDNLGHPDAEHVRAKIGSTDPQRPQDDPAP